MTPERFEQIERLYQAVCEGNAEQREALLAQTDPELRRELESILAERTGGEMLDPQGIQNLQQLIEDETLAKVSIGSTLGPYRIESKLGAGGMGEVFRARDMRLRRPVAIKVAREGFTNRFDREASAISSLNHPNICTLYDVGPNYLVMELVEGETLAARIKSGPLSLETVLLYASQIAAALTEAHRKGIVHRDLKPGNIMIAKSGVKVLDFGLAKTGEDDTVTASYMIMGTPAYMAPEQKKGKPADARVDIYSFGCILYEMLTGERPGTRRKRTPMRRLEKIIDRCLEEAPELRWQSVAELERELAAVKPRAIPKATLIATAILLVLSAAGAYFYLHSAPKLTNKDTIVLADFENRTGDPVFDDTLRQGLSLALEQSPYLRLLSENKVQQTLSLMGHPKEARLEAGLAQQVCERTASTALVEGSITLFGNQYVLSLIARNCYTGDILDRERMLAAKRADVLTSLSQAANNFRTKVGESLTTVEKHSAPLPEATTTSLEALKMYSTGMKVNVSRGSEAGVAFFQRAVEIDPEFALARAHLGLSYSNIGEWALSIENTEKAWLLRERVSDPEKYFIDFMYQRDVIGNLEKAYQTLELWVQTYPRADTPPTPHDFLGGIAAVGTGRFERAIEMLEHRLSTDPDFIFTYGGLASNYFFVGRFREAENTLARAFERKLQNPNVLAIRYSIAALNGDKDQVERVVALAKGKRGAEHRLAHVEAVALARLGRLEAAGRSSNRAMDLASQEGDRDVPAAYQAARAVWEALCGNATVGRTIAQTALKKSNDREIEYEAGLALALSGDPLGAETLASDLERRRPEDTFVRFTYAPVLGALARLRRGKPADALQRLETARQYELAVNGLNANAARYLGGLHSAYVRGEALMAMHRYTEAAVEFQKILDNRGIVWLDPIGALARLQLARVYRLSGDKAKAKSAYESFFAIWKDADAEIPVFKQAKLEYGRLP